MCKRRKSVREKNSVTGKKEIKMFIPGEIEYSKKKDYIDVDLHELYEKAVAELGLQQTKRDQIITVYIALFAFLTPAVLESDAMNIRAQGFLFLAAAIIGILFALIIVRYRIYKEVYWLCCQSISVFFGIRKKELKKELIQSVFYKVLEKKGNKYIGKKKVGKKNGKLKFRRLYYTRKNFFSSESIYYLIHILITSGVFGLSCGMIFNLELNRRILLGVLVGIILGAVLLWKYFHECIKLYRVLVDGTDKSFNHTFSMAWFLHFYV